MLTGNTQIWQRSGMSNFWKHRSSPSPSVLHKRKTEALKREEVCPKPTQLDSSRTRVRSWLTRFLIQFFCSVCKLGYCEFSLRADTVINKGAMGWICKNTRSWPEACSNHSVNYLNESKSLIFKDRNWSSVGRRTTETSPDNKVNECIAAFTGAEARKLLAALRNGRFGMQLMG